MTKSSKEMKSDPIRNSNTGENKDQIKHVKNDLPASKLILSQLQDPRVSILTVTTLISFVMQDESNRSYIEPAATVLLLIANAAVSTLQASSAKLNRFNQIIYQACTLIWLMNQQHFKSHTTWIQGALYYFRLVTALSLSASDLNSQTEVDQSKYDNAKQVMRYFVTSGIGQIVYTAAIVILGLPESFVPLHFLWVKLLSGLPAAGLKFNIPDPDAMPQKGKYVSNWLLFRYVVVGLYIGGATVFGYVWWYMFYDQGPQISFYQLSHYRQCAELFPEIGCEMFAKHSSLKATTIGLSVLILIQMLSVMNCLSENASLTLIPASSNPYLVGALALSMALHFIILHVPFLAEAFSVSPLTQVEWFGVVRIASPITLLDEGLKLISRSYIDPVPAKDDSSKKD